MTPDGVLLVDKPAGKTSHDVVAAVRRELPRGTRAGHAGTLDPFATGLLLVLVGRATRAQRFFMALPKTYVATARLGAVSSTGDPEGDRAELEIECSAGTYVRSLIADLGDAYCEALRRTAIGPFRVQDADPARVVPLEDALGFLPRRRLEGEDARRAAHGAAVPGEAGGEHVLLVDERGAIAVAQPREGGLLKPVVGFRPS